MKNKSKIFNFIIRLIQGATIGVGAVLPGVSGGVLATVFGIYQPLMEVFAHPIKSIKKHISMLIPVILGVIIGFLGLAKAVTVLFQSNEELAVCLFTGLIAGEIPSLFKNASSYGKKKSSYIAMSVAFVALLSVLMFFKYATKISVTPNYFWYAVCGCFWSLGIIVPGMSASSPLLFLGLYEPLLELITNAVHQLIAFLTGKEAFGAAFIAMDIPSCLFFAVGFLGILILLSRPVNKLFGTFPSEMNHIIIGIVTATVVPLFPTSFSSTKDFIIKILCIVVGFAVSFLLEKGTSLLEKKFCTDETEKAEN